ncbi:hypothetical protein L249_7798 [Ophiocordyceps polyrhachis-furcata BCC 54312]|uniref:Uncharacterized protein n=1 Tax=Ophiocordyceps polyrhachis-furcata BCC 54312 TaxID=1330021 RepID=A0A367L0X6_9HYPO|nr:hypothetical protein L249_7798 [Ophiocordyceps polyrhachis-furcata BCC 54312]
MKPSTASWLSLARWKKVPMLPSTTASPPSLAPSIRSTEAEEEAGRLRPRTHDEAPAVMTVDDTSLPWLHGSPQISSEDWSADVQQLIEETERAFEAVGHAIHEAQLTSWLLDATDSPTTPPPAVSDTGRKQHKRVRLFEKKPPTISLTLAGTVGNALHQRFGRVVADEMLTPDQLEKLKHDREELMGSSSSQDGRWSTDSSQSVWTEQSDGPFQLEKLITPLSTADHDEGQASPASTPPGEKEMRTVSEDEEENDLEEEEEEEDEDEDEDDDDEDEDEDDEEDGPPPTPPPKSPARLLARPLPTIRLSTTSEAARAVTKKHDEVIYLQSTPLSFANRAFRHGPIAFPRPQTAGFGQDRDETVDWVAFHMAILGGAGDLVTGMYEDDQNQMADEMVAWFETFGFETHGRLVAAGGSSGPSRTGRLSAADADLPIPVHCDETRPSRSDDAISLYRYEKTGERGKGGDRVGERRPLVVGEEVPEEGAAEVTRMGCNLEHDLGEFLRWERQFCYGGVF